MMTSVNWTVPQGLLDLVDFVLRPICLICREPIDLDSRQDFRKERSPVCRRCEGSIMPVPEPTCRRCGSPDPSGGAGRCRMCSRLPADLGRVRSAALAGGTGGKLVHLFKYRGWRSLAAPLALAIVSSRWSDAGFWDADLLLPVPISKVRRRERGYNQCELLADRLSGLVGIPAWGGALERVSWVRPQVGLPLGERLRNVKDAFAIPRTARARLAGRRVILVDDVITTGATISACFLALREGGVSEVSSVSFGRADDGPAAGAGGRASISW